MANRDHSLDDGIIRAAYEEFLAHGFQNASLHKIAEKAGVSTGAIYTRYKNKDALFVSLLSGFIDKLGEIFTPAAAEYEKAGQIGTTEALLNAINYEERIYFRLLSDYYDECTLFFSRSDGSSVEKMVSRLMDTKTEQTVEFFHRSLRKSTERGRCQAHHGGAVLVFPSAAERTSRRRKGHILPSRTA